MRTVFHTYRFHLADNRDAQAYAALREQLRATPGRGSLMHVLVEPGAKQPPYADGEVIELETKHLLSNQWNTAEWRVFDWYEGIYPDRHICAGHYLDITPEMIDARQRRHCCGYCGFQTDTPAGEFCTQCLDSPYLKREELHLLRMRPAATTFDAKRSPLTEGEAAELLPLYVKRQTTGADSRATAKLRKERDDIAREYAAAVDHAKTKHDGLLWLMDHNISTENVIYYRHTGRFGFGWHSPIGPEIYGELVDKLCEFPFDYDIKRA